MSNDSDDRDASGEVIASGSYCELNQDASTCSLDAKANRTEHDLINRSSDEILAHRLTVKMESDDSTDTSSSASASAFNVKKRLRELENELNETRSLLTVNQLQTENLLETERRKCREELASVERIMREQLRDYQNQYQSEIDRLKYQNERLEYKLRHEIKNDFADKATPEVKELRSESMLSAVTKTFRQKVNSLTTVPNALTSEEPRMKHPSDENELILPYEQEVSALKDKLRLTDQRLQTYEVILTGLMRNVGKDQILNSIPSSECEADLPSLIEKLEVKESNKSLFEQSTEESGSDQLPESLSLISQLICENSAVQIQNERLAKEIEELNGFINNGAVCRSISSAPTEIMPNLAKRVSDSSSESSSSTATGRLLLQRARSLDLTNLDTDDRINDSLKSEASASCADCKELDKQMKQLLEEQMKQNEDLNKINLELRVVRTDLKREQEMRFLLESKFALQAKELDDSIEELQKGLHAKQQQISQFRGLLDQCVEHVHGQVMQVETDNRRLLVELQQLQNENQVLLGKHLARSDILARETINLPQQLDQAQEQCLRLREELIALQVAKERTEETYTSQLTMLKEQQQLKQQEKESLEENLMQELEKLRNERDRAQGELQALQSRYDDTDTHLRDCQAKIASLVNDYQKQVDDLEEQVKRLTIAKNTAEQENANLKAKVQNLQLELDNSETVQRDFVKLSQTLQIQLEQIRQADTEVRWQHEDDISDCNQCKRVFNNKKEKRHCNHCGKIFCGECCSKNVIGGPNRRLFKVCQVCHTLLDRDTAPYFSSSLPRNSS